MIKQLLNSLSPNNVICQCLADQLFASAKKKKFSPPANQDILPNIVQLLLII